jgi:hypothetical protein
MSLAIINARPMIIPHPTWRTARQRPNFHLDFKQGTVDLRAGNLGTFSRNLVKNVWNGSQFVSVAANVPALQRDPATGLWGYLHEPAATNVITNSAGNGFTVGIPGTLPSGWSSPALATGLTRQVIGGGVEQGISYVDFRITGTASTTAGFQLAFNSANLTAAANGQQWSASVFAKITDGTAVGVSGYVNALQMFSSGGANLGAVETTSPVLDSATPLGLARRNNSGVLNQATTAFVQQRFRVAITTGVVVDFTIRIGWPQLEATPTPTSPIITTGSAVTRPADEWTWTGGQLNWYDQAGGTMICEALARTTESGQFPRYWQLHGGTEQNRIAMNSSSNSSTRYSCVVGGVNQGSFDVGGVRTPGTAVRSAYSFANNAYSGSTNGEAVVPLPGSEPNGSLPAVSSFTIGNGVNSSVVVNNINALIREITYLPPGSGQNRLQAISTL